MSKEIIPTGVAASARLRVAEALLALRRTLGYTQSQMGQLVGVSQGQIAKWEKGDQTPAGQVFAKLATVAPDEQKLWWYEQAGLKQVSMPAHSDTRSIPLLHDSAAAGTPRVIDEEEIEQLISMPRSWLPKGGTLYAIRISGDSMSPAVCDGFICIIDVQQRDPKKLVERMVAARDTDGVTIKWLRSDGDQYLLVPNNVSPRYPVRIMREEGDFSIVGRVVKWIGEPQQPRK